jgi:hypothetical protein
MFDAAKFIEAARAASKSKPVAINLPTIGAAFKKKLTVADIEHAGAVREKLSSAGKLDRSMSIAVGLAQSICGPDSKCVFDVDNSDHLDILAALPWESVRGLMTDDEAGND